MPPTVRSDRHLIPADAASVRSLLERLETSAALGDLSRDDRDCTLLILAEALNNVVEHGYAGDPGWVCLSRRGGHVWRIVDAAAPAPPLPHPALPPGEAEGGFGLFLIRTLTDHMRLRRLRGLNVLTLHIRAGFETQPPLAKAG